MRVVGNIPDMSAEGRWEGSKFVCMVNREGLLPDPTAKQKYPTKY
jgi:hypothetical protein